MLTRDEQAAIVKLADRLSAVRARALRQVSRHEISQRMADANVARAQDVLSEYLKEAG